MHICAEHRDATADKKDDKKDGSSAATGGAAAGSASVGGAAAGSAPVGGAAAPDIYSAGSGAAPAASAAADECQLGGSAEQAVAAIGLVAAVLGEEVGGEMARRLLDGILQVRTPSSAPFLFPFLNPHTPCSSHCFNTFGLICTYSRTNVCCRLLSVRRPVSPPHRANGHGHAQRL